MMTITQMAALAQIMGTEGSDFLIGTSGDDEVLGLGGADFILAGNGDDTVDGGAGDDIIFGGAGNDSLFGGANNDFLFGGNGNDTLIRSSGQDIANGGAGADTFVLGAEPSVAGSNAFIIADFVAGEDKVLLAGTIDADGEVITSLADIDTNGDGVLNGLDDNFEVSPLGDLTFQTAGGSTVFRNVLELSATDFEFLDIA